MRSRWRRKPLQWVVCALCFLSCLSGTATGGEAFQGHAATHPSLEKKKIHLQMRIAKAKRKADSLRYYRSVARQLIIGKVAITASRRK
jgi:hypothetical protein